MRPALFLIALLFTACSPALPDASPQAPATPTLPAGELASAVKTQPVASRETSDRSPVREPRFVRTSISGVSIEAVVFDARSHTLRVADQPGGPGSRWADSREAGTALGGLAAVNGGFFTPEGDPLGRVVAGGKPIGSVNRASSLGAGWFLEKNGRPALARRDAFQGAREALQSGPFLVEHGKAVGGLSEKQSSARTFVATNGASGWVIARTGACSLSQLAGALAGTDLGGVRIQTALNLDGGRSSEIWVSPEITGGPAFSRPIWNKPVRNFLVLRPR